MILTITNTQMKHIVQFRPQKSFMYQSGEEVVCIIKTMLWTSNRCGSHGVKIHLDQASTCICFKSE